MFHKAMVTSLSMSLALAWMSAVERLRMSSPRFSSPASSSISRLDILEMLSGVSEMHQKVTVRTVNIKGEDTITCFTLELIKGLLNSVEGERGEHLKVLSFAVDIVEADGHVGACESLQGGH